MAFGIMSIVSYGPNDICIGDKSFFSRKTYKKITNLNIVKIYEKHVFVRNLLKTHIDITDIKPLHNDIISHIFSLTTFETCLINGIKNATISLFQPHIHTRSWGTAHDNLLIRKIYNDLHNTEMQFAKVTYQKILNAAILSLSRKRLMLRINRQLKNRQNHIFLRELRSVHLSLFT